LITAASSGAALVGYGAFGAGVVDLLAEAADGEQPSVLVIVADHLPDDVAEEADEAAHHSGVSWLAVEAEHQRVVVGPLVVPGKGACHRCFRRRRVQHDAQWPVTEALRAAQTRQESVRPQGFLPHHLRIVAGVAAVMMRSDSEPGTVVTVPLNRSAMTKDLVVGCHGCPRCGATPTPRPELGVLLGLRHQEGAISASSAH
jgi:bacteriocin biosynthesis cyclodehydratase domain-containing protein